MGATVFTNEEVIQIVHDLYVFKLYCLASFVLLFYDILITFGDEVEWIWRRKFNWFTVLWFLNRYLSPLGFIVITVCELRSYSGIDSVWQAAAHSDDSRLPAFQDPRWVGKACDHYVLFPEILRIFTTSITGFIFIVRLYATYSRSRAVVVIGLCFLAGELAVKIWSFLGARRLQLPPGQFGCILTSGPDNLQVSISQLKSSGKV
ncbi:hypothetical protein D9619_012116 [Psilocybe cf. subviscida]|uniref:DUF6533 domain-containing protein n=1 Tax=Psilocybe cf. subviscida TaxID=2480587 RepID=A0A8H5B7F6_9AGAR|nr:hypothetical protein D9619_012116 [Psilocybe cf. subviscida]